MTITRLTVPFLAAAIQALACVTAVEVPGAVSEAAPGGEPTSVDTRWAGAEAAARGGVTCIFRG
jgi:hypothetical protein